MKKLVFTLFSMLAIATTTLAQSAEATPMSKEEKAKLKAKQAEEMAAAYKAAGLTADEVTKVTAIAEEASKKSSEVKKDASLTDEAKKEKLKEITDEKNAKIKEFMGKERYKAYGEMRKKQKAEAEAAAANKQ
jgi:hypothetical protein